MTAGTETPRLSQLSRDISKETMAVKSAVETLNPTRVRLTVEAAFDELKPDLDSAYKKIAQQVNIPGFRRGKAPAPVIDRRLGRDVVLEQAVSEAVPRLYSQAVQDNNIHALGQPELDIQEFTDGADLKFSAEIDVRPEVELPEYRGIEVTVDDSEVADEDVVSQLDTLRDRFAVLTGVERPAQAGDHVSLDLMASKDGEPIEDATAKGVSYEVGSGAMVEGLDDAITGLSAGESATFASTLAGGDRAGEEVDVTATVNTVKVKELPELDDDFAQMASEFDTVEELRADTRQRLERSAKVQQASGARDKVLEALLDRADVPVPEGVLRGEIDWRRSAFQERLDALGVSLADYRAVEGISDEEHESQLHDRARQDLKAQFVLDAIAEKEQVSVGESELSQHLVEHAMRAGVSPDQYADQVVRSGQVPALVSDVRRSKALALVVEAATVTDASGRPVEVEPPREQPEPAQQAGDEEHAGQQGEQRAPEETGEETDERAEQDTGER